MSVSGYTCMLSYSELLYMPHAWSAPSFRLTENRSSAARCSGSAITVGAISSRFTSGGSSSAFQSPTHVSVNIHALCAAHSDTMSNSWWAPRLRAMSRMSRRAWYTAIRSSCTVLPWTSLRPIKGSSVHMDGASPRYRSRLCICSPSPSSSGCVSMRSAWCFNAPTSNTWMRSSGIRAALDMCAPTLLLTLAGTSR